MLCNYLIDHLYLLARNPRKGEADPGGEAGRAGEARLVYSFPRVLAGPYVVTATVGGRALRGSPFEYNRLVGQACANQTKVMEPT